MTAFFPMPAALKNATERRTAYAGGAVGLFKSTLVIGPNVTITEVEAAEATFGGYARITIANWGLPILAPLSGYAIYSPSFQFSSTPADPVVEENIGGVFFVDAAGALRILAPLTLFAMGGPGQGYFGSLVEYFPTNYTP